MKRKRPLNTEKVLALLDEMRESVTRIEKKGLACEEVLKEINAAIRVNRKILNTVPFALELWKHSQEIASRLFDMERVVKREMGQDVD